MKNKSNLKDSFLKQNMLVQPLQMNALLYYLKHIKICNKMQFKNYFYLKSLTTVTLSTNLNLSHPLWAELNI
jgi:hypothetical protein